VTPGVQDAVGSRGDSGSAGVSPAAVAAGVALAAATVAGAAALRSGTEGHAAADPAPNPAAPDGGRAGDGGEQLAATGTPVDASDEAGLI
jgi:hypothetical protein